MSVSSPGAPAPPVSAPDAVLVGAGDIAACGAASTEATARLLDGLPGTVFVLGDNAYPSGTAEIYANCYNPTWGRHRGRTFAAPGNHDWDVNAGAPYFAYFGASAGPAGLGYYSYDLGAWHVLSLNSNVPAHAGSAQYQWVKSDLAGSSTPCTLAYWHHPRFSSGSHGNNGQMADIWRLLRSTNAEVVVTGHDHDYERFAPQDGEGRYDPFGVREFVVGTGGAEQRPLAMRQPNSEVFDGQTYGVIKLSLHARSYDWSFLPIEGQSFRDGGAGDCR